MWGVTIAQAGIIRETATATRDDSLMLKVRAQEVRGARRLRGASDADAILVTSLITAASVCIECIASKTGLKADQAATAVRILGKALSLTTQAGRCDACLRLTVVHRLN